MLHGIKTKASSFNQATINLPHGKVQGLWGVSEVGRPSTVDNGHGDVVNPDDPAHISRGWEPACCIDNAM